MTDDDDVGDEEVRRMLWWDRSTAFALSGASSLEIGAGWNANATPVKLAASAALMVEKRACRQLLDAFDML